MTASTKSMSVVTEPKDTYSHEPDENIDDLINIPGYDPDLQPTAGEIRRAKMKVDLCILPFIVVCFCFLQFDRTNIGNALTDTLRADIHVSNSAINMAQTLFTVGFIITELPFNVISRYIGPERFLPITMFVWGVATWSQIFIKNASGLVTARFFIGALEGGSLRYDTRYSGQIYHLVTFAALTLCRLVHTYEANLRATGHDLDALDGLVVQLVDWLRSIGLPINHTAYMLGDIVFARFAKLRPHSQVLASITARRGGGEEEDVDLAQSLLDDRSFSDDFPALAYPGFIGLELFDMGLGGAEVSWPQWEGELYSWT